MKVSDDRGINLNTYGIEGYDDHISVKDEQICTLLLQLAPSIVQGNILNSRGNIPLKCEGKPQLSF